MYRSTAKVIVAIIVVLTCILVGVSYLIDSVLMRILCVLFGGIFSFAVWYPFMSCPHCGHLLPRQHIDSTHCPYCGEYLND